MANKSGLGSKEMWVQAQAVQKTFNGYVAAHNHYVLSNGANAWASDHSHVVNGSGWPQAKYETVVMGGHGYNVVEAPELPLEEAAPFIRLVIERMLELMESEERWVKGQSHAWNEEAGVDAFCLIGALGRAQQELGLHNISGSLLEEARRAVCRSIETFLQRAVMEDTGFSSMPEFNDNAKTGYEDVRLWLKSLFDRL